MTGTIINALSILLAGTLGLFLKKGISENMSRSIQNALGLLVLLIGIQYGLKVENLAILGISLALGAVIGEWQQWEARLEKMGELLASKFSNGESQFVKGFISSSLLFCVGAMAILGALENGLTGKYDILLVKSMLDAIFALIFAASMGIGVIFSALPVLIYQGAISLGAEILKPFFTDSLINNISALGGILIAALGLNILGITKIKVANLLPAIIILPIIIFIFNKI